MQKIIALLVLSVFIACSTSVPKQTTTPKPDPSPGEVIFTPEAKDDIDLDKLEYYDPIVVMKDTPAPQDGVLYSARQSAECSLDASTARRLTIEHTALSKLRVFENNQKDKYILNLETSLKEATKKDWWDQNSDWLYLSSGALLGVVTSIVIFSVAVDIKKQGD